jgi:hypothetical protein
VGKSVLEQYLAAHHHKAPPSLSRQNKQQRDAMFVIPLFMHPPIYSFFAPSVFLVSVRAKWEKQEEKLNFTEKNESDQLRV